RPAFRRLDVDIVEMRKTRRIFQIAERRSAVPPDRLGALRRGARCPRRQWQTARGECERGGGKQRSAIHWTPPKNSVSERNRSRLRSVAVSAQRARFCRSDA